MARTDPQLNFRIPAELKERLEKAAARNQRTLTGELIARLEESFAHPKDRIPGSPEEIKAFAEGVAQALIEGGWSPNLGAAPDKAGGFPGKVRRQPKAG